MAGCTICHADMIYFRKKHAAANQGLAFICVYSALNLQPFLQILSQNWFKGKKHRTLPNTMGERTIVSLTFSKSVSESNTTPFGIADEDTSGFHALYLATGAGASEVKPVGWVVKDL